MSSKCATKQSLVYTLLCAALVCFAFCYYASTYLSPIGVSNIKLYLMILCIYGVCIFIFQGIFCRLLGSNCSRRSEILLSVVCGITGVVWLVRAYNEELIDKGFGFPSRLLRHRIPISVYYLAIIVVSIMIIISIRRSNNVSKIYRMSLACFFVYLESMLLVTRYVRGETSMEMYHITAYTNSIINVQSRTPYGLEATSIYGHYGILYFLPVAVLRFIGANKWMAVTITIALFGAMAYIAQTMLFNYIFKNDTFYTLAMVCNAVMHIERNDGIYYQINPHRILFPSLLLLVCYWYINSKQYRRRYEAILWMLVSLSIIWNTETGIVCCGVIAVVTFYMSSCERGRYLFSSLFVKLGLAVFSVLMAYIIPNLYNIVCGGRWNTILEYIYPSGNLFKNIIPVSSVDVSDTVGHATSTVQASMQFDMQSILETSFGTPFEGYWLYIIVLGGFLFVNFVRLVKFDLPENDIFMAIVSFMGLGVFTYYMNRATSSNFAVVIFYLVFVLVYILETESKQCLIAPINEKNLFRDNAPQKIIYLLGIVIVSVLCISSVGAMGERLERYEETYNNAEKMHDYLWHYTEILEDIPDDTTIAIVGFDANTIAALLDVNSHVHIRDFEDMTNEGLIKMQDVLEQEDFPYVMVLGLSDGQKEYIPDKYNVFYDYGDNDYLYNLAE